MKNEHDGHPADLAAGYDVVGSIATNVADGFTMTAVGDLIVSRAVTKSQDLGFDDVVKILHDADVTFGNLEVNIFDIRSFCGSPQAEYGGAYHLSLPEVAPDLRAMGFNILPGRWRAPLMLCYSSFDSILFRCSLQCRAPRVCTWRRSRMRSRKGGNSRYHLLNLDNNGTAPRLQLKRHCRSVEFFPRMGLRFAALENRQAFDAKRACQMTLSVRF